MAPTVALSSSTSDRAITRRAALGAFALAIPARAQDAPWRYKGVEIGIQSFSVKHLELDAALDAIQELGLHSVELWSGHFEPLRKFRELADGREKLRHWRIWDGAAEADAVGREFRKRGLRLNALNLTMRADFSLEEVEAAFAMARAMGVDKITSSSNVSAAPQIDQVAKRYEIYVGFHNHARIKADEFATPEDFAKALKGGSEFLGVNLDTGHFTAAGFDALGYVISNHDKLITLHIKDRKLNDGPKVRLGEGDCPNDKILHALRDNEWDIPANIEYAYPADDPLAEIRQHVEYMKAALDA